MGVAALEAGKHVSMQKPPAINVAECDKLIEAASRSDKVFRVFGELSVLSSDGESQGNFSIRVPLASRCPSE